MMKTIACYQMNEKVSGSYMGYYSAWYNSNLKLTVTGDFSYSAKCHSCNTRFYISPGRMRSFYSMKKIICPVCGDIHYQENIMYSPIAEKAVPYGIIIKLIQFKHKIEMRIYCSSYFLNKYESLYYKETFIFDLKNNEVLWKKKSWVKCEWEEKIIKIGYLNDFFLLEKESVIYLLRYHFMHFDDSLKTVLQKLIDCINKYIIDKGYHKSRFFIRGDKFYSFGGNILNIAHRLRFMGSKNFSELCNIKCKKWLAFTDRVEKNWEQEVEKIQQESRLPYLDCVLRYFNIPEKNFLKQNFKFQNIKLLQTLFRELPYDEAVSAYNIMIDCKNNYDIDTFCRAYNSFKRLYPSLTAKRLLNMKYWKDTYLMYKDADNKTLKDIYVKRIKIGELHDFLIPRKNLQKIKQRCLNVPQDIIRKMEMQLDFYKIKVINYSRDLVYAGEILHNCARTYMDRIGNNLQLVTIADNKGKLMALLEVKDCCIVQAKLKNNKPVYHNTEVNEKVLEFAKHLNFKVTTNDVNVEINSEKIKSA